MTVYLTSASHSLLLFFRSGPNFWDTKDLEHGYTFQRLNDHEILLMNLLWIYSKILLLNCPFCLP